MVTLDIYMLIHALSATEACNPTRLQLIVQKDYDQNVLFLKTSSMRSEEYWHVIASHHFHLIGNGSCFQNLFCIFLEFPEVSVRVERKGFTSLFLP